MFDGVRARKARRLGAAVLVLAVAVLAGVVALRGGGVPGGYALALAEYPEMAPYPGDRSDDRAYAAWQEGLDSQQRDLGDTAVLRGFFARSTQTFLTETPGENRVYSPLSAYMALSMLAQVTGGESQAQLLALLGSDSMDALRRQAGDVWNCNYRDDGMQTSILANALWLNENVRCKRDAADALARDFYADAYRGEMGSEGFNEALRGWLDAHSGGLLEEQAVVASLGQNDVLALTSTVCFKARWYDEFWAGATAPQTFHSPAGDMQVDFMHQWQEQSYFRGTQFAAVGQAFRESGVMWFLLPDEGLSPEALLDDAQALDFLFTADKHQWSDQKYLKVNMAIPKFDVTAQLDLSAGLQALGVTDVYDPSRSAFTALTAAGDAPIALSRTCQTARVVIDEEGCTAAAYTVAVGVAFSDEEDEKEVVDFVLDRPFVFCLTGPSDLPLFVGTVNFPAGE